MKHTGFFLILFILVFTSYSCTKRTISGNSKVVNQYRNITGFNSVNVVGAYEVYLKKGEKELLEIVADENLLPVITSEVSDSVLKISHEKIIIRSKSLKLIITYKNISSLNFSGATELSGDSCLSFNNLNINLSGAGKIDLSLHANRLNASISGGADIDFNGDANQLEVNITGAANLNTLMLAANNCKIDISGFGKAKVNALKKLEVNISGAGKVEYKGNPELKQSITGAGKVIKLSD
jgi:hypothetical protein